MNILWFVLLCLLMPNAYENIKCYWLFTVGKPCKGRFINFFPSMVHYVGELPRTTDNFLPSQSVKTTDGSADHHNRVGELRCMRQVTSSSWWAKVPKTSNKDSIRAYLGLLRSSRCNWRSSLSWAILPELWGVVPQNFRQVKSLLFLDATCTVFRWF